MRIYSMTATFGKLEHETLTLKPGLNVISAPNEWGKSTWCAFLVAMLYGIETRAKSTKTALADKERFLPWSGSPMAGRIDLNWQGRDITIERQTKRRIPLGEFRAYETASGLPVEELTGENCGQKLLGVEQSVFRRAGFIRQSELPVTQDEALRRRLNALVTTGDESGRADQLADSLKDLKNRVRYNRKGLLPQTEQERQELEDRLRELEELEGNTGDLRRQLDQVSRQRKDLQHHQKMLAYHQAQAALGQVQQAREDRDGAKRRLFDLEGSCAGLPSREKAQQGLQELANLRQAWYQVQSQAQQTVEIPSEPQLTGPFAGMSVQQAREMVHRDGKLYGMLSTSRIPLILLLVGGAGLVSALVLALLKVYLFGAAAGMVALVALGWGVYEQLTANKKLQALVKKYGTADVTHWTDGIRSYEEAQRAYRQKVEGLHSSRSHTDDRVAALRRRTEQLCGDRDPKVLEEYWQQVVSAWDQCQQARREYQQAENHLSAIEAMVRPVEQPEGADSLTYTEEETARYLEETALEERNLQNRLGQQQGRMAQLGGKAALCRQLEQKNRRAEQLERTYAALVLAQETLEQAGTELQRKFAPRITQRAQELMAAMTQGRYYGLTMGADFSLQAGAGQEDVLHDVLWRSDGTMDQLYLALRLAVAEELTPQAPLVLDDALVRFDDARMAAALEILKSMAKDRQILLFTCQNRELEWA